MLFQWQTFFSLASDRAYKSFTAGGFQGALVTTHINKHIYLDTSYIPVEAPGDFGGPNLKKKCCSSVVELY